MNNLYKKFVFKLIVFSLVLFAIGTVLFYTVLQSYYLPIFPISLAFFVLITLFFHWFILKGGQSRMAAFAKIFMVSNMVRLFIYVIFIAVYLYFFREHAKPFLLCFLFLYFSFTMFEIVAVLRDLKHLSSNQNSKK